MRVVDSPQLFPGGDKMNLLRLLSVAVVVALSSIAPGDAFAADADDEGFVSLFNGKDLSGWKTEGNWIVEKDGSVTLKPRPGERGWQRYGSYLWIDRPYADFTLKVEYKHPPGGNSGVFVRVKEMANPVRTGMEIQILDSHKKKGKLGPHDCGGVIGTVGPSKNAAKPAGQWNSMTVTCHKSHMTVELNGEQIIDLALDKSAVKDRPLSGYVGLQDHGQPLSFRNVKIKELK